MSGTMFTEIINIPSISSDSAISITSSTGNIYIGGYTFPRVEAGDDNVLTTNGSGTLSFVSENVVKEVVGTSFAIASSDNTIEITVAQNTILTLPNPFTKNIGDIVYITKVADGSYTVTLNPYDSELISGQSSHVISQEYGTAKLYTNGIDWFLLN